MCLRRVRRTPSGKERPQGVKKWGFFVFFKLGDHPEEVLRRMGEIGIRHMPVIQYGKLRGLISNRDLFRFLLQESEAGGKALQYNDFTFL